MYIKSFCCGLVVTLEFIQKHSPVSFLPHILCKVYVWVFIKVFLLQNRKSAIFLKYIKNILYETNFPGFPFNTNYIINYTLLFALTVSSTPPPKLELLLRLLLKPPSITTTNSYFSLLKNVVRCSAKTYHVGHLHRRRCPYYQPEISSASTDFWKHTPFKTYNLRHASLMNDLNARTTFPLDYSALSNTLLGYCKNNVSHQPSTTFKKPPKHLAQLFSNATRCS